MDAIVIALVFIMILLLAGLIVCFYKISPQHVQENILKTIDKITQ